MPAIEQKLIECDQLKFDKDNPRLPKRLQGVSDETVVIDYMVRNGNILELMKSIAETGYSSAEPLLVVEDKIDGKFIVVEGNRRLTAVKLLRAPQLAKLRVKSITDAVEKAKYIPEEIPVIVYESRKEILDYLGYRHITGVKEWGALEKARYLDQLYNIHCTDENKNEIYTKLAKMIGSRSDYVFKLHQALRLYNKANDDAYYGAKINEEEISFSWLTTALGYREIINFLNIQDDYSDELVALNEDNFQKIFLWMFDPKKRIIEDSRQISKLASIVAQPKALEQLEKGSAIEEAVLYTSAPSDTFMWMLKTSKQYLKQAKDAIEQLSEEPSGAKELLEDITKTAKTITGGLVSNFSNDEEREEDLTDEERAILMKVLKKTNK